MGGEADDPASSGPDDTGTGVIKAGTPSTLNVSDEDASAGATAEETGGSTGTQNDSVSGSQESMPPTAMAKESTTKQPAGQHAKGDTLVENVEKLTEEFEEKQLQLQRAREELHRQNRSAAARAMEVLQNKLQSLTQNIGSNRSNVQDLRTNIKDLKKSQLALFDEEEEHLSRVRRGELEQKVFEITGRKIEYENIQAQRQRLDAEIAQRTAVLDAIQEIEDDKANSTVTADRANELLRRIDYFNKYLDPDKNISDELQELQGQNFGQAMSKFNSLDIVRAAKAEAHAEKQRTHQTAMFELNLKRREMERRMRELEANKKQFKKKTEKGLTYLIKYELKHSDAPCDTVRTVESGGERSPEIESISSDEDEDGLADDAQLTAAEILKKAERNAKGGDWKARQLRAGRIMDHTEVLELRPTVAFIKPYNGYLGEKSYGPGGPPKSWGWIRKLVCEFVDGTMLRFFNSDKPLELLREEKHRVQQSEVVLDRHIEQHRNERAAYEVVDALIEEHMMDIVRRLIQDVSYVSTFMRDKAMSLLISAMPANVLGVGTSTRAQGTDFASTSLPSMIAELRSQHHRHRSTSGPGKKALPETVPYLDPASPLVVVPARTMIEVAVKSNRRDIFGTPIPTHDDEFPARSPPNQSSKPKFDGITIDVSTRKKTLEVPSGAKQAFIATQGEEEWWKSLIFIPQKSERRPRKKSTGSTTCVQSLQVPDTGSLASSIFAVGTSTGWVAVYRVFAGYAHTDEVQLLAECRPHKGLKAEVIGAPNAGVRKIVFSADASQILTLHANGQLQLFHLFGSSGETSVKVKPSGPASMVKHRDQIPVKILEAVLWISHEDFMRPPPQKKKTKRVVNPEADRRAQMKKGAADHFIESAAFFPGLTMSMMHSAILIGCRNGTLVKYNLRGRTSFYLPIVATFEPPTFAGLKQKKQGLSLDIEVEGSVSGKQGIGRLFGNPRRFVCREFFEGHDAAIVDIGWTAKTPPTMVTVDKAGIILEWSYSLEFFSGFGWFTPKRRFEYDLHFAPQGRVGGDLTLYTARLQAAANEVHIVTERQGTLFVTFLDLSSGQLWPASIVATNSTPENQADYTLCYVPGIDACGSDYYYVVVNRSVRVFSLALGKLVRQFPLPLEYRRPKLAVVGQEHIVIAETGKEYLQFFQLHFSDEIGEWSAEPVKDTSIQSYTSSTLKVHDGRNSPQPQDELDIAALEQFRLRRLVVEHRERVNCWDISDHHAKHEIQKIVYDIVDTAVSESINKGKRRYAILSKLGLARKVSHKS